MEFLQYMLGLNNHSLIHSLSALISVVVSTSEGVEYMTHSKGNIIDLQILEKIMSILKEQEDGCVTQRFLLAILQKMSAKNSS